MLSQNENEITRQVLRSRFDACMINGQQKEASALIDLAWNMGYRLLAASMVMAFAEEQQKLDDQIS